MKVVCGGYSNVSAPKAHIRVLPRSRHKLDSKHLMVWVHSDQIRGEVGYCQRRASAVARLVLFVSTVLCLLLVGTDKESLEQNFSDPHRSFVKLCWWPHRRPLIHTSKKCLLDKNTLENLLFFFPLLFLDCRGCKEKRANETRLQVATECLDMARSLQPEQVRPHTAPVVQLAQMLFHACKTVQEAYYLMIDINIYIYIYIWTISARWQ